MSEDLLASGRVQTYNSESVMKGIIDKRAPCQKRGRRQK